MQAVRKKTHTWIGKKYRKVYRFICEGCGKLRVTFCNEVREGGVCRTCMKEQPDPNQASLGI